MLKQGSLFLLCTDTGDVLEGSEQGLYFHDMRYISRQTLRINGERLVPLLADASPGGEAHFELTNPDLNDSAGETVLLKESLGISRAKALGDSYAETIRIQNFGTRPVQLAVDLDYEADFADMFTVRGMPAGTRGKHHKARWHGDALHFQYDGADGHQRTAQLNFSEGPTHHTGGAIHYALLLDGRQCWELHVRCDVLELHSADLEDRPNRLEGPSLEVQKRAHAGVLGSTCEVESDNPLFNSILGRSFADLHMLRMSQRGSEFFAAGVPWYVALFGRDSLITAMEVAAYEPEICANTLRELARLQGEKEDDWRDEQPGKILHELRINERANLNEIPQTPYYGSVDSTPLFLVLLGIYTSWSGTLDLFHELQSNVQRALGWIDRYGDSDHDGFIDYQRRSSGGGRNQGWKDSGNGVVMEDGALAEPPIALPEVQGEVYRAWRSMADLYERDGEPGTALALREKAKALYRAFNRQFWLPGSGYLAFCRQADGRFSQSIASNGAHTLWTGIVDPRHARAVVERVLKPDMFSGWGIRTLSAEDVSYNPVDYQVGSVWPHDTAMIVAGMQRAGFCEQANRVFGALIDAATNFDHFRLPEVFAGYDRSLASRPVRYPVACSPQAWAAGAVPFALSSMLGLQPSALDKRLVIKKPSLPDAVNRIKVSGVVIGSASVDLVYQRAVGGQTVVAVTRSRGDVSVRIEA